MKKKGHAFMRNDRLGYMCTCPTNLGTVVRCSAHIQLKVSYYRLHRSCGKVMFLHLSVILFTGGSAIPPLGRHQPGQTPPGQTPPNSACWDTVNNWVVCILLECILVTYTSFQFFKQRRNINTHSTKKSNFKISFFFHFSK